MRVIDRSAGMDDLMGRTGIPTEAHLGLRARDGVLILIALLGAIGSLGGQRDHWWYPYAAGAFLIVGAAVLVQGFAWPWVADRSRSLIQRRRLDRMARDLSSEFHKLVAQFGILVDAQNANSLVRYFWDLAACDPAWRSKLPATMPPWYFATFFSLVCRRPDKWDGGYEGLKSRAKDFASVVMQYEQICVRPPLDAIRRLDRDQLPDNIRHKVNLLREDYAAFVRQYRVFAQGANSRCEEQAFPEYLEVPEPI